MKEIFIELQDTLIKAAIKENEKIKECFFEEISSEPSSGQIFKGIIKNIVPAIKCAFVDIGFSKNAYMYIEDKSEKLKKGQEVVVEVIKEGIENKGPKVTERISIPGRYTVITKGQTGISFSKKIDDIGYKEYLEKNLFIPEDVELMIRTNAQNVPIDVLNNEITVLYEKYNKILTEANREVKPKLLYGDRSIISKVLRDHVDYKTKRIFVSDKDIYDFILKFIEECVDINTEVILHTNNITLFNYYGIEKEILSLRNNRVNLSNGGNIVIDKTEGMYVIDVNSSKNVKTNAIWKTAFTTNIQAAEEIGRQIRLRNLSGIIIVDFIDMDRQDHKREVIEKLNESFRDDKNKTVIYPFTELNLVQIARRRRGRSIAEYIEESCDLCGGKGKRIKLSYLLGLIKNEIERINSENGIEDIYIELNEVYKKEVLEDILRFVTSINGIYNNIYISFEHIENFKVQPLIFSNQIRTLEKCKIYDKSSLQK